MKSIQKFLQKYLNIKIKKKLIDYQELLNNDKKITNGELLAYMDKNVSQKASEQGRKQNPELIGNLDETIVQFE